MKLFLFATCYFVLVAGIYGSDDHYRFRRQSTSISLSNQVSPVNKETFLLINGDRVVSLSGAGAEAYGALGPFTCDLVNNEVSFQNRIGGTTVTLMGIQTCRVFNNTLTTQTTGNTVYGMNFDEGRVYSDGQSALYIENSATGIINFIERLRLNAPTVVEPVTVLVVERGNQLVLNIDNTNALNDNMAEAMDDTLVLTGSQCRNVERGTSIIYNSEVLNIFTGAASPMTIPNIEEFYVLMDVQGCLEFSRHTPTRTGAPLTGPGLLCTGDSQLSMGQTIGFFSEDASVNNQIMGDLVRGQLTFTGDSTGGMVIGGLGGFDGVTLFTVTESTETRSFPDAGGIQFNGGMVTINDRFNNVIQQYGTSGTPASLTYYGGTMVQSFDSSTTTPFNGAVTSGSGGLNVAVTGGVNTMVFAYPGGNSFIQNGITMLQNNIPTTPAPIPRFSGRSSSFGTIELFANGELVQETSTSMSAEIGRTQCIIYNSDTVDVFQNCDNTMQVNRFANINPLQVADSQGRLVSFMGSAPNPIQGPGRFYFSGMNGFFTGRSEINTLITNLNNAGARAGVSITRTVNEQGNLAASLVSSGINLFMFGVMNSSIVPIESDEGLLYSEGVLGISQVIPIPQQATLQFVGMSAIIRGGPGPDLNVSLSGPSFVQMFTGSTTYTQAPDPSEIIPGGGILYTSTAGSVYNRDSRVSSALYRAVNDIGGITESTMQTNLTFYDGRIIRMFEQSADVLLTGPGNLYTIPGERAFFSSDSALNNRIPSTVSQLVPFIVRYDSNTGNVVINSTSTTTITTIGVDSNRVRIPTGTRMVFVEMNMITVIPGTGTQQIIGMGINRIIIFNGISTIPISTMDRFEFSSPGSFFIDETQGNAIYITEPAVESTVANTINNAFTTFTFPSISQPTVRTVITSAQNVNADFGQDVITNNQSTVTLRCRAGNSNPPAMFAFFQRDRNTQNFTSLVGAANVVVTSGMNEATIEISNVAFNTTEYRCDATNILGTATVFSRITGLIGRAPEIQDNFFTGSVTPGTGVVTARRMNPMTIRPIIDDSDVTDRSRITSRVLIGCRAKGRGIPDITWTTEPAGLLDFSLASVNVSSPGPGQSVLSVDLQRNNVLCVTYICNATNSFGFQEARAEVCPERYVRRNDGTPGICETPFMTCGIGVQEVINTFTRFRQDTSMRMEVQEQVTFAQLPEGLFKPILQFCDLGVCPQTVFEFNTTDFSSCTRSCNSGTQRREATCIRRMGTAIFNATTQDCIERGVMLPVLTQACNEFPCPRFDIGEFSECSRTCRGGIMTRNVSCLVPDLVDGEIFDPENGTFSEVALQNCGMNAPAQTARCNSDILCPVRYAASFGEVCDSFNCQTVSFTCVATNEPEPWPVDNEVCEDQGLVVGDPVRSCGGQVCNFGIWNRTRDSSCSVTCGRGVERYNVVCLNRTDTTQPPINDRYCNGNERPLSVESCFDVNCPGTCDEEPFGCSIIGLFRLCKTENLPLISQCCKSCPAQVQALVG